MKTVKVKIEDDKEFEIKVDNKDLDIHMVNIEIINSRILTRIIKI
ncbi:hypothetical protein ES708_27760 [subsurface metagenome]